MSGIVFLLTIAAAFVCAWLVNPVVGGLLTFVFLITHRINTQQLNERKGRKS